MMKLYAIFYTPGFVFDEVFRIPINTRKHKEVKIPDDVHMFEIVEREEVMLNNHLLMGTFKRVGKQCFPDGTVYTREEVKKAFPHDKLLYSRITSEFVVHTRMNCWKEFNPKIHKVI